MTGSAKIGWKRRKYLRRALRMRDGDDCCFCGARLTFEPNKSVPGRPPKSYATIEHVIPRSKGGTNAQTNLKLSCWTCNNVRGSDESFFYFRQRMS